MFSNISHLQLDCSRKVNRRERKGLLVRERWKRRRQHENNNWESSQRHQQHRWGQLYRQRMFLLKEDKKMPINSWINNQHTNNNNTINNNNINDTGSHQEWLLRWEEAEDTELIHLKDIEMIKYNQAWELQPQVLTNMDIKALHPNLLNRITISAIPLQISLQLQSNHQQYKAWITTNIKKRDKKK